MTRALAFQHIAKRFGATEALTDVSFEVEPGGVHALLGENGAGKSTLLHIAYGMLHADSGSITMPRPDGTEYSVSAFASPRAARSAGIGMVHQHFTSIPALTVAENIALAAGWEETGRRAEQRAVSVVEHLALPLRVTDHVEDLSVQLRQRLEIVKALATDARVLLLDEPTAVLAPPEITELFAFVRRFAAGGGAVVLITHKLGEVFAVADHLTVLRRGAVVLDDALDHQTPRSVSHAMIGTELSRSVRRPTIPGEILVSASRLRLSAERATGAENTFTVRGGEIVGIAAVEGNGQRDLLRAIAGVDDVVVTAGTLEVEGPVAFIPEDRTTEGMIGSFTLAENLQLVAREPAAAWIQWSKVQARANLLMESHDVRAADSNVRAGSLSGGNQQKFILARSLETRPRVIVAEDPTRGLDLLATESVHESLRAAAADGAAVIVHSSDLDEVLTLADRILVMTAGRVVEFGVPASREAVGTAMVSAAIDA